MKLKNEGMKNWYFLCCCCCCCFGAKGQSVVVQQAYFDPPLGLRFPVLDVRQLLYDPALPVPEPGWGGSLAHHIPGIGAGIRFSQMAACYATKEGIWFGGIYAGGTDVLKRTDLLLGASRRLGAGWSMGITAGMGTLRATGTAGAKWPSYSIGLSRLIARSWIFTSTLENPWAAPGRWRPPLLLRTGLLFAPEKNFTIKCLLITEEDQATALFLGFQLMPTEKVWAKAGWLSGSQVLLAGFGFRYRNCAIEAGGRFHFYTGFSSSLAVHFNGNEP
ncbi:MAG: hypothetical protein ACO1NW_11415 [Chitinophagaceae bacterium]